MPSTFPAARWSVAWLLNVWMRRRTEYIQAKRKPSACNNGALTRSLHIRLANGGAGVTLDLQQLLRRLALSDLLQACNTAIGRAPTGVEACKLSSCLHDYGLQKRSSMIAEPKVNPLRALSALSGWADITRFMRARAVNWQTQSQSLLTSVFG